MISSKISITTDDEPTPSEALSSTTSEREAWVNAIDEELDSIERNGTWEASSLVKSTPLPTHVVLNLKRDSEGNVERFKARIVAGGNLQVYGRDYDDTYAPVAEFPIVRMILCLVVSNNWHIAQVDIKTAFLNGPIEEDIWVTSPRGIPGQETRVFKLKKAIYGLKQAHLAWHRKLCFVN